MLYCNIIYFENIFKKNHSFNNGNCEYWWVMCEGIIRNKL